MKSYKFLIFFAAMVLLIPAFSVSALECDSCFKSGDSLAGKVKIGSNYIGANYYYSVNNNEYFNVNFSGSFNVDLDYSHSSQTGNEEVGFELEFCTNTSNMSQSGLEAIYSSYYNYIDYVFFNGNYMFLGEGDWTRSPCFTAFIRLDLNYTDNVGSSSSTFSFTSYSNRNNVFAFHPQFGYMAILRYVDLIYYENDDYNNALENAKEIGKSQEIINQQQQTNEKLDDIKNMDIPDSSKEDLDDSSYQDYQDAEDNLLDSIGDADLSSVDIAIDADSSNFIWDTITDILNSHPLIISTVIAILSIGIIKLALGR